MKNSSKQPRRASARGFSLIEVLVSIVILSFGVLGMVGMQVAALQSNRDARLQSAGVRLAREAAELMRDNKEVSVTTTTTANPFLVTFTGTLPTASTEDCFAVSCTTPFNIAQYNIREWIGRVNTELPGAQIKICYDTQPYDSAGIPQWTCTDTGTVIVVKLGWTRGSTNKTSGTALNTANNVPPSVILSVTGGAAV